MPIGPKGQKRPADTTTPASNEREEKTAAAGT
ncbi:hypothetical protein SAMN05444161_3126 [Rhizobiales bacterium GAS191]|nr:hypothetical protein SAMN05444161_3126 [Rhizobiales bacterium GAS191]